MLSAISLGKKTEVDVNDQLDSENISWGLDACKNSYEELVVSYSGNAVHAVANFLTQLNQLTLQAPL